MLGIDLIIFDADGTLRRCTVEGQPCPNVPGEWELIDGVKEKLQEIDWGQTMYGIASNQAGIGLGLIDQKEALQMLCDTLCEATGYWPPTSCVKLCPHKPDEGCDCRKPKPQMLLDIMKYWGIKPERTLFVGDMPSDKKAAKAAGCQYMTANEFFNRKDKDEPTEAVRTKGLPSVPEGGEADKDRQERLPGAGHVGSKESDRPQMPGDLLKAGPDPVNFGESP